MEQTNSIDPTVALVCISILAAVALIGIFVTKKQGFGKYTTSLLLLVLVLFLSSIFFLMGTITSTMFGNIMFAVTGFGGGLLSAKKLDE